MAGRFDGFGVFLLGEAALGKQCRGRAGKCLVVDDGGEFALGAGVFAFEVSAVGVVVEGGFLVRASYLDDGGEARGGFVGLTLFDVGAAEVQQQVGLVFGCEFVEVDGLVYFECLVVVAAVEVAMPPQELGFGAVRGLGVEGKVILNEDEGVRFLGGIGRSGYQEVGLGLVDGAGGSFAVFCHEVDATGVVPFVEHLLGAIKGVGGLFDADGFLCLAGEWQQTAQQGAGNMSQGRFFHVGKSLKQK